MAIAADYRDEELRTCRFHALVRPNPPPQMSTDMERLELKGEVVKIFRGDEALKIGNFVHFQVFAYRPSSELYP